MTRHPLLDRLLRKAGASVDSPPSADAWQAVLAFVAKALHDADQDRYTLERSIEISSREMQGLYQNLKLSNERHRMLFEGNPVPSWVFDAETFVFLEVNAAMIETYGYTRAELLSMTVIDLEQTGTSLVNEFAHDDEPRIKHIGVRGHRHKDGHARAIDITAQRVAYDGKPAVLGIGIDITESRRLEDRLHHAQKMDAIGHLAGGIAHDFNNIIAVILANVEFAIEDVEPSHASTAELHEILGAAQRAAGLTHQLLAFSRQQPRRLEYVELNTIVGDVRSMLSRIVGANITMTTDLDVALGTIEADASQIEQLLINLMVNARDAMPDGGELAIATANVDVDEVLASQVGIVRGRFVQLTVRDTGCGMTEDVCLRIFEPFFTTKAVGKGTGLGLSTVFGIVKAGNGGICVSSRPNQGTTFTIYLPREDAPRRSRPTTSNELAVGRGTILLVEDDEQVRQVIRRYLMRWGYDLLEAPNGRVALEIADQHPGTIDLLLTDLVMPEMDGRSLGKCMLVRRPETKVIYMSGYSDHTVVKSFQPTDHFVQKPFTAKALSQLVQRVVGTPTR